MHALPESSSGKSQRVKLLLIPVLGLVLLALIWRSNDESPVAIDSPAALNETLDSNSTAGNGGNAAEAGSRLAVQTIEWPRFDLVSVLQHDPLSLPPLLRKLSGLRETDDGEASESSAGPSPESEQQSLLERWQQRLTAWEQQAVNAVFVSERGNSAIIGSRTVQEGDWLEEGVRVVAIGRDGVILEVSAP